MIKEEWKNFESTMKEMKPEHPLVSIPSLNRLLKVAFYAGWGGCMNSIKNSPTQEIMEANIREAFDELSKLPD